ncbi:MAG: hypothetical protein HY048_01890 [Acidobacteria bacterium]|nr:hypothetical protein [Acidobacteriota bacterium]
MRDWKRIRRVVGETMREIGILVVVFVPLDAAFAPGALRPSTVGLVVIAAFTAIVCGIIMESEKHS